MALKALIQPILLSLGAKIETADPTCRFSQTKDHEFSDAFDLDNIATIDKIVDKFERHRGKSLTLSLASQRDFTREGVTGDPLKPYLSPIYLRGDNHSLFAIVPTDVLLVLPQLISSGSISHIAIGFEPPYHGSGNIREINFISAS